MKRHIIYTFAALALVLSCNRAEPEQQSGDLIRIGATIADVPSTKALINKNDLKGGEGKQNPEVKIYDDLTGFTGTINGTSYTNGDVNYINDTTVWASGVGESATWNFKSGINWRWTRSGVHHFYGWLTKDPEGKTPADLGDVNFEDKILSVPAITFTKDTKQFDFSYSDIVEVPVDLNSGINAPSSVNLPLYHLFTALDVWVANKVNAPISNMSVKFSNIENAKTAEINYSLTATKRVEYGDGTLGDFVYGGDVTSLTAEQTTPVSLYNGTNNCRLLWPQDWSAVTDATKKPKVSVTCKIGDGIASFDNIALPDNFTKMEAGKRYKLVLTISAGKLYINIKVADWIDTDPLAYSLKMNTSMRLFDSWLYRYDTDGDYATYTNWATSHMAVSEGRETGVSPSGRPLRSPQIQLVTTGVADATVANSGTFELRVDNDDFEIIRANKNTVGVVTSYEASTDGVLNIAAGDDVYTYFYIVPKVNVTPANPVAKVSLIYNDPVTGPQKVAFNYSALPGYSDDSAEIWAYYFPADGYNITGKLRMYFQDYDHPLVPTPTQN